MKLTPALNAIKYLKIWLKFLRLLQSRSSSFLILIWVKIDSVKYKSDSNAPMAILIFDKKSQIEMNKVFHLKKVAELAAFKFNKENVRHV